MIMRKEQFHYFFIFLIPLLLLVMLVVSLIIELTTVQEIVFLVFISIILFLYVFFILYPVVRMISLTKRLADESNSLEYIESHINFFPVSNFIKTVREKYLEGYKSDILRHQAEINYLQRQINPHFLYNSLESIRGNAIVKGADEIAKMTEALATFFRYSISQKGNMVSLEDEINNVKDYFIIQQFRFNNKFSIKITSNISDYQFPNYYLPKMTLQPMIENSIYHGLEPKIGKGKIELRVTITDSRLILNVIDDGIGIPKDKLYEINRICEKIEPVIRILSACLT